MPVRFLSDAELARLSGWLSEIAEHDLITFFTLTDDDLGWLGSAAVDRLADRLGIGAGERAPLLSSYGGWEGRTRRDHRVQVLDRLGWRALAAWDSARAETYHRLAPLLELPRPARLDGLLDVDTELGMTRLP